MFRNSSAVYDLIYEGAGKDYAAEAKVVRDAIRARNPRARSLLDVACGTGGHLVHLRHWFEAAGLDLEAGLLAEARLKVSGVPLIQADMRSFEFHRCFDAIVCLFSSIGYLHSKEELDATLRRMCRHLAPGGVLVIDGWIRPDAWIEPGVVHADAGRRAGTAAARVGLSRRKGKVTYLEMHHLIGTVGGVKYVVDHHELTLFTPEEYEDAFRQAGLAVEVMPSPIRGRDRYVAVQSDNTS